jgi:hypothetical protein
MKPLAIPSGGERGDGGGEINNVQCKAIGIMNPPV